RDRGAQCVGRVARRGAGELRHVGEDLDGQLVDPAHLRHENWGNQRDVAASISSVICATWSKSILPASGSSSIAFTAASRSPLIAASTVTSCDATIRRRLSVSTAGAWP